jgi:hypothetical protein
MQEPIFQFSTITLLLVLSLAGMVYVIRMDIQLARYAARVKRKDTLFWLDHHFAYQLNRDIIDTLQERREDDSYSFRESSIKPPHQQWRNPRDRQSGEGYND